jgi:hypothetical protein
MWFGSEEALMRDDEPLDIRRQTKTYAAIRLRFRPQPWRVVPSFFTLVVLNRPSISLSSVTAKPTSAIKASDLIQGVL